LTTIGAIEAASNNDDVSSAWSTERAWSAVLMPSPTDQKAFKRSYEKGAEVNATDAKGATAVRDAASMGHPKRQQLDDVHICRETLLGTFGRTLS
jgi:hypothetical protein